MFTCNIKGHAQNR